MSENILNIEAATVGLADLVDRLTATGEAAVIVKSGQPVARLVPIPAPGHVVQDLIAFLHAWRDTHPEPDEQFGWAVEASRIAIEAPHDPWD